MSEKFYRKEINPESIGQTLDGCELHEYDPKTFTLLVFPEIFEEQKLEAYLRNKQYSFMYVGPVETALLVPKSIAKELKEKFEALVA